MTMPVSARKDGTNYIASTGPDVCWTPFGSLWLPVAYNSIAHLSDAIRLSSNTQDNGNQDFHLNSRVEGVQGHEAGTGKGVVLPGYTGTGYAATIESTGSVGVNGYMIVRDGDPAMINRHDQGPPEAQASLIQLTIPLNIPLLEE